MKTKKINRIKGFTLAEVTIVLCIIAVLAAIMISVLGGKTDKNKGLFKKAYSITERTVVELVNDETYYPYDYSNFGFKETTDVKIIGADMYTSTTNWNSPVTSQQSSVDKLIKFCNLFANNLNLAENPSTISSSSCIFTTTDGVYWTIKKESSVVNGFLIKLDVDGNGNGVGKPANVNAISTYGNVKNRDIFYIYVRYDGKIQLPDSDDTAKSYLKSANLNQES